jgi:hypothetical protein
MFESSAAKQIKSSSIFYWSLVAIYLMHAAVIVITPYFIHMSNMRNHNTTPLEQIKITLSTCLKEFFVYLSAMRKFG